MPTSFFEATINIPSASLLSIELKDVSSYGAKHMSIISLVLSSNKSIVFTLLLFHVSCSFSEGMAYSSPVKENRILETLF